MKLLLAAVLLAGCGRVAFDARGDAGGVAGDGDADPLADMRLDAPPHGSVTHDEDGDGIVEGVDSCPHMTGDKSDTDGDGVGDICDPEIMNPRQRITRFEGFENGVPADLSADPGWVQRPDALGWPGTSFGFVAWDPHPVTNVDIAVAWDILSIPATPTHQLLIGMDQPGGGRTYGEVYQGGTQAFTSITNYDGSSTYSNFDQISFGTITTGRVDMTLHAEETPRILDFRATWTGMPQRRSFSAVAPYGPAPSLGVTVRDLEAELRYLLVIETN